MKRMHIHLAVEGLERFRRRPHSSATRQWLLFLSSITEENRVP
jgi:hypothetical protein